MAAKSPLMTTLHESARHLALTHRELTLRAQAQEADIAAAMVPILARHRPGIDAAAEEKAAAQDALMRLVQANPQLFKRPRSVTVDGVKAGYRKELDSLDWDDEQVVIARIQAMLPDQVDLLIRTQTSLVADALPQLDATTLRQIGVRQVSGSDQAFVSIGDSDVDKLVKAILADAARRQGDDDTPRAKKGKVKIKEVA
ncbi:MAG: hypothetical protein Q8O33_12905 [Pseudomonadota bacterium]|nr:hypothetical protein [Pseudomonadota bacterium]